MTYAQFREALSMVAKFGDDGAPHEDLPVARWMDLRNARLVVQCADRWVITHRGWRVLEEPTMPAMRPSDRPVQRKSPREKRSPRRTPSIGHAHPMHEQHQQHQARSA